MARSYAKARERMRWWNALDTYAPRGGPHHEKTGQSAFEQPLDLHRLLTEFPCSSLKALDDQRLAGNVRVALSRYQSARRHHVPRKDFIDAAKFILDRIAALRAELAHATVLDSAHAAVLHRVDEITGRGTGVAINTELEDLSDAIARVLEPEPKRGTIRDEPLRELVYYLSAVYRWRTGKKPSREFDHSAKWHRDNPDSRPLMERELDGNDFARFVFLIEKAYLAGLKAHLKKSHGGNTPALSERDLNARVAQFAFGPIRRAVISVVDVRRKEEWR